MITLSMNKAPASTRPTIERIDDVTYCVLFQGQQFFIGEYITARQGMLKVLGGFNPITGETTATK
jgi:hypothetical protein